MPKRGYWTTRFGFYLAAIGSACGLGNLWRFPYVVGENGGGAFVLLYVICALLIGLPLLIGELMLGRFTRKSVMAATTQISRSNKNIFIWIGRLSVLMSLVVLAYYAVISGWVLHFSTQFLVGLVKPEVLYEEGRFDYLLANGWLQMGLASVHLVITIVIVMRGLQDGVERWIGGMMPVFAGLLLLLVAKSLSLPSAGEALRFLFYPDFSKLQLSSLMQAIGHVCFTLSVGFGTMVTFGSYLRENDHIPTAGFRVTVVDTVLSLFAGLLLFPIVLQAAQVSLTDPGLLFDALPRFLVQLSGGSFFGFAFFICLYLAALGASIGLLEVIVSNLVDQTKVSRFSASWIAGGLALFLAMIPALSGSAFKSIRFDGKSLLELLDSLLINFFLPLIALGLAWAIARGLHRNEEEKLFIDENKIESVVLFSHWRFVLRWLVPAVIGFAFLLQFIAFFKS